MANITTMFQIMIAKREEKKIKIRKSLGLEF